MLPCGWEFVPFINLLFTAKVVVSTQTITSPPPAQKKQSLIYRNKWASTHSVSWRMDGTRSERIFCWVPVPLLPMVNSSFAFFCYLPSNYQGEVGICFFLGNSWVWLFENKKFKEPPGSSSFISRRFKFFAQVHILEIHRGVIMRWGQG